jgi:hypothetical protein
MLLSLVLALSVFVTSFTAASADAPVMEGPFVETGALLVADCGDFQVIDYYVLNSTVKYFFDEDGNLLNLMVHLWGTDTLTNSVTGVSYEMSFANNNFVDFTLSPPQGTTAGNAVRLVIPGAGAVFLEVGRIVLDQSGHVYFQAGQHQFWDADFEALCAAMA